MSAALSLTEEQLEAIIARAAKAGAREAIALVSPLPPPPKRIERRPRVASAKAAEHVAKKNRRQR